LNRPNFFFSQFRTTSSPKMNGQIQLSQNRSNHLMKTNSVTAIESVMDHRGIRTQSSSQTPPLTRGGRIVPDIQIKNIITHKDV
jgi:hypothetical protein